jgi:2-polyprenyl-3-methyl-5-hydroxy-6-metoxy-1,4-benzoquinol methylase
VENFTCQLCGGHQARLLYAASMASSSAHASFLPSTGRRDAHHNPIVSCKDCGFVSTFPRDDPSTLTNAYRDLEDDEYISEETGRRITAARHLQFVSRHCPKQGRMLDVGCSVGYFASAALAAGWNVVGIEPSRWAADVAWQENPQMEIHCGLFEEVDLPLHSFDCITMWDVLEHVADPLAILIRAASLLKPAGYLFLNVPNIDSRTARVLRSRWPLLLREHLWYFSPSTLTKFLLRVGLTPVEMIPNSVTFSLRAILVRLAQHEDSMTPRMLKWLTGTQSLARRQVTFRMGELLVAASKSPQSFHNSQKASVITAST